MFLDFNVYSFTRHIAEDLKKLNLPDDKTISEMTEEERNLLYFKVHDLDGNGKLDGLEMYYSATHHSLSQADHDHEHDFNEDDEDYEDENKTGEGTQFKLLNANGSGDSVDLNFNHVIGKCNSLNNRLIITLCIFTRIFHYFCQTEILDNFLEVADLNNDGYLHYPEYAAALKLANINTEPESQPKREIN